MEKIKRLYPVFAVMMIGAIASATASAPIEVAIGSWHA